MTSPSACATAGPNVFYDCSATAALGDSGSFESWASGVLYEDVRIDGAGLRLSYDMTRSQGGGWTAANSIADNCQARDFDIRGPDTHPIFLSTPRIRFTSGIARPILRPSRAVRSNLFFRLNLHRRRLRRRRPRLK